MPCRFKSTFYAFYEENLILKGLLPLFSKAWEFIKIQLSAQWALVVIKTKMTFRSLQNE